MKKFLISILLFCLVHCGFKVVGPQDVSVDLVCECPKMECLKYYHTDDEILNSCVTARKPLYIKACDLALIRAKRHMQECKYVQEEYEFK